MKNLTAPSRFLQYSVFLVCSVAALSAQVQTGTITGVVIDASGAVIPIARITLSASDQTILTRTTDAEGRYTLRGLPGGEYRLQVAAKGFALYQSPRLQVIPGGRLTHDVSLAVTLARQEVTVADRVQFDVDPTNNASTLTLGQAELSALSDDRDVLGEDLQALAGPTAGPNGGEIYIDGFSGGKLPPKSSIREVRVNQNPFSAEYDRLGYGRIEIFTKPGSSSLHGQTFFDFGNSSLNSRNPFAPEKPSYQRRMFEGNLSGPIGKRSSFFVEAERRDIGQASVVNALVLDPSFNIVPYQQAVLSPAANTEISLRLDHQLNSANTLVGRYEWEQDAQSNAGLDTFSLPSRALTNASREQVVQMTETAVLSATAINELRFQFRRGRETSLSLGTAPAEQVLDAFSGGGASGGLSSVNQRRWELGNVLSLVRNRHTLKFGGRLRGVSLDDASMADYNGMFTFTSLEAYRVTQIGLRDGITPARIRELGGGASQFSIFRGDPSASVRRFDGALFVQDDWRLRPQLTLSAGLRYEVQNNIGNPGSWAGRFGFAWAPRWPTKGQPFAVIRGGFGLFLDRVGESLTLEARRLDGVRQRQYLIGEPDFYPNIPSNELLAGYFEQEAVRIIDRAMRAPSLAQTAISIERQFPKNITATLTYTNSRGVHMLRSRNINAPLPGTFDPRLPESGVHPFPRSNMYLYESSGVFRQNQLIVNVNARVNRRISLFGFYVWSKANSNTDGAGSFPADQYSLRGEYGRAGYDVRHRGSVGGSLEAPWGVTVSPFTVANTGQPFNITSGTDLNGDSIYNDRPAWATNLERPSVVHTRYGVFDTSPTTGQTVIPRNLGFGPGRFTLNLRIAKSFSFGENASGGGAGNDEGHRGPHGGGPGDGHDGPGHGGSSSGSGRYTITVSAFGRNVLNNVNLAAPVGNLSSPSFGQSVALAGMGHYHGGASANRTVELQVRFAF